MVVPLLSRNSWAIDEAARLVQGGLVGARDVAIQKNAPCGVRLVRDPSVPVPRLASGQIDPAALLYADRLIPLEPAPDYSEGMVSISPVFFPPPGFPPSYLGSKTAVYPYPYNVLMVQECPVNPYTGEVNSPTSWFWNVRIGDKLRFGDTGPLYTVVGPMTTYTSELFVNCGTPGVDFPGTKSPLIKYVNGVPTELDFLFLVNGKDDNGDGFIDEGFDGVDNNLDGVIDDLARVGGRDLGPGARIEQDLQRALHDRPPARPRAGEPGRRAAVERGDRPDDLVDDGRAVAPAGQPVLGRRGHRADPDRPARADDDLLLSLELQDVGLSPPHLDRRPRRPLRPHPHRLPPAPPPPGPRPQPPRPRAEARHRDHHPERPHRPDHLVHTHTIRYRTYRHVGL